MSLKIERTEPIIVLPFRQATTESSVPNRRRRVQPNNVERLRAGEGKTVSATKKNSHFFETMRKYFAAIYSDKTINEMNKGTLNPILSVLVQSTKNIPRTISTLSGITGLGALVSKVFSSEKRSFFNSWGFIGSSLITTVAFLGLDKLASAVLKNALTPNSFDDEDFQKSFVKGIIKQLNEGLAKEIKITPNTRTKIKNGDIEGIKKSLQIKEFSDESGVYLYVKYDKHRAEADEVNFPIKSISSDKGKKTGYGIRILLDRTLKRDPIPMWLNIIIENSPLNTKGTFEPVGEPIKKSFNDFMEEGWFKDISPDLKLLLKVIYEKTDLTSSRFTNNARYSYPVRVGGGLT